MATGFTIWLTGLSGAGKSTLSERLAPVLRERGHKVEVLDGDIVRTNLSYGLGFSREDRDRNIARIAFVCELLTHNDVVAITAAISPYAEARAKARETIGAFVEVYVKCSLDELVKRDVKGLYAKAISGEIKNFTGVSDPYEAPLQPDIVVDTGVESIEASLDKILRYLDERAFIAPAQAVA